MELKFLETKLDTWNLSLDNYNFAAGIGLIE